MLNIFNPYALKGVTLRNRIGMSPMTMYQSTDGQFNDFHTMYLGARAAGGFGLIFPEQVAISAEGRTSVHCAGIWKDEQIENHAKVTSMIKRMGGTPGIQLGHTGRKGSQYPPWEQGGAQIGSDETNGWQVSGPSAISFDGIQNFPVHELTRDEIKGICADFKDAARRALDAGYEWLEIHYAHGYLGASFFSPIANHRTDEYGGSVENRARFLVEALDAVREVWPEKFPLTARLGCEDFDPEGIQFEDSIVAAAMMKEHGLDLVDVSTGGNVSIKTNAARDDMGFMVERAARIKREVAIPVATSWNLGVPENADWAIREGKIDVVLLGRPALANPHWPVWAARELGHDDPFSMVPEDWSWWLKNFRGHGPSIGLPPVPEKVEIN